jgi:hypothetical protein
MKTVIRLLAVLVLTLSIPRIQTSAQRLNPDQITFKNIAMGELSDEDGVHLGFTKFSASDGPGLIMQYEDFESREKALSYFEKQLAKSVKIIERGSKRNEGGKIVGERARLLLRFDAGKTIPAVLWTDGVKYHEIYSSSLKNILELEKVYKY